MSAAAAIAAMDECMPVVSDLRVETVSHHQSFLDLEPVWNRLVEQSGIGHPFVRHEWARTWWECFGHGSRLHVLVVKAGDEPIAIAPLMLTERRMYGLRLRILQSMYNDHVPRFEFITSHRPLEAYCAIWRCLVEQKEQWDVLQICQLPGDSRTLVELPRLAGADGVPTGVWPSAHSPYVRLQGSWDGYLQSLDAKHRSNLRNRFKRLGRLGKVELEVVSAGERLPGALEDGFRLEAAAWKDRAGSAIECRADLRLFYERLASRAAQRGWLRLHFLTVDGRRIAFQYSIGYAHKLYLLKPGYDPAYAAYSPGNLLCSMVLEDAFERGLTEHDFLGAADPWKLEWTGESRPHFWLFLFRNRLRTRVVHGIKFRLLPWLERQSLYLALRQRFGGGR
jgi:CelD/BcsL family acetyltransferase involved in cellulose biosynthesis